MSNFVQVTKRLIIETQSAIANWIAYCMDNERFFFDQNKKFIATNDWKNIAWRGVKAQHSTHSGGKFYLLVHRGVDFRINLYVYVWWKMEIIESRYGYSVATVAFSMVILVIVAICVVIMIGALPEIELPFCTKWVWFHDLSSRMMCVCRKTFFKKKKYTPKKQWDRKLTYS